MAPRCLGTQVDDVTLTATPCRFAVKCKVRERASMLGDGSCKAVPSADHGWPRCFQASHDSGDYAVITGVYQRVESWMITA
jgi:hypothetical protein